MRVAPKIVLADEVHQTLERWSHGRSTPARQVLRAKIVLAGLWRKRFFEKGLAGIEKDAPRSGRKPTARHAIAKKIIEWTTQKKPANATHWSTRTLALELGTSHAMVSRVWRANGLKPHLVKTFKLSNDKRFVEKLVDVVGLYLAPPEHALVLSCDEKSQI